MPARTRTTKTKPIPATKRRTRTPAAAPPAAPHVVSAPTPRPGTKLAMLASRLTTMDGATMAELTAATSWQAHSVRAALSGLRKTTTIAACLGADGLRRWRIAP